MPASAISTRPSKTSLYRENQEAISKVLRSENILRSIEILPNQLLSLKTCSWEQYWEPVIDVFSAKQIELLRCLKSARSQYIKSNFNLAYAQSYCYAYFVFLRTILSAKQPNEIFSTVLGMVLCIESSIVLARSNIEGFAAVTSNVRNPVYLLAKIRCPQAYEDPKSLPLLMACRSSRFDSEFIDVYYHYRQYSIDVKRKISFLVYPSVCMNSRSESFRCIQKFTSAITQKTDPRARSRAKCIADYAMTPFIQRGLVADSEVSFSVADLGGGSGALSQNIFERLLENNIDVFEKKKIKWTLIDLQPHNTRRFLKNKQLLRSVAGIHCERRDWKHWLQGKYQSNYDCRFDVILCCRLFDNLSQFSIGKVDDWYQVRKLSRNVLSKSDWHDGNYLPHMCLAPDGKGVSRLVASNARIPLLVGTTFQLLSLSDYFRGIDTLWRGDFNEVSVAGQVFFPVRRLNSDSLLLTDDQSSIDRYRLSTLSMMCDLSQWVVIEDVDMTPAILLRHLKEMNLSNLSASDATDRKHMHGTNLLCLCKKENQHHLPGKRFW